jgi:hypothetical protein
MLPLLALFAWLVITSIGCGDKAKNEADDFSGKLFDAKLPDTSGVYRQDPTNVEVMSFQYMFNKDTTGEMRLKKGAQLQRVPFIWQVEQDSIRIRFSNVDGRLFIKKLPVGYELFNKQFRVTLIPSE